MSTSHSTTSSDSTPPTSPTPALGSRENWWGEHETDEPDRRTGHTECRGTDPADYVAPRLALQLVEPVCGRTGAPLSDPILYLPKQLEIADGQYIEYLRHRHRRQVNEETGYTNRGETTLTAAIGAMPRLKYGNLKLQHLAYPTRRSWGCDFAG